MSSKLIIAMPCVGRDPRGKVGGPIIVRAKDGGHRAAGPTFAVCQRIEPSVVGISCRQKIVGQDAPDSGLFPTNQCLGLLQCPARDDRLEPESRLGIMIASIARTAEGRSSL